ncbi:MAG: CPBP family intramembrane metalloprotease [Phycisphaerales bacterium]|nr:CPBP family intramembrane metalloprotease [Phycisphaerales bacterium]
MLAAHADTLQAADLVLTTLGAGIAVVYLWREVRRQRRLNRTNTPWTGDAAAAAAGSASTAGGLGLRHAVFSLLLLVGLVAALRLALVGAESGTEPPGTAAWFRGHSAEVLGRFITAGAMLWMLIAAQRGARFAKSCDDLLPREGAAAGQVGLLTRPLGSEGRGLLLALPAALGVTAAVDGFAVVSKLALRAIAPQTGPVQHPVLLALEAGGWGVWGSVLLVVSAVVAAPLVEELFYRGILLGALRRRLMSDGLAVAFSGLLFGLMHIGVPDAVLPLTVMGLLLGYLRIRHHSLWMCVLIHAYFNARTMSFALLAPEVLRARM